MQAPAKRDRPIANAATIRMVGAYHRPQGIKTAVLIAARSVI